MWEWTTETKIRKNGNNTNYTFAVMRGGSFKYSGSFSPVVYRDGSTEARYEGVHVGFRTVLYIK